MRRICVAVAIAAMALAGSPVALGGESPCASLAAAERKFAAMSVSSNTQAAFLANLGDDAVLFHPYAVNGRKWFEAHPGGSGLLTWDPSLAVVSQSGDLGWTTGPWEYRKTRAMSETPLAYGHFATVWRRESDGVWRVAIDCGIDHPKAETVEAPWSGGACVADAHTAPSGITGSPSAVLAAAEAQFAKALLARGVQRAYRDALEDGCRIYRDGTQPVVGRKQGLAFLKADDVPVTWKNEGASAAAAGDLGYTYGRGERALKNGAVNRFTYFRVWQRKGSAPWKIALDVVLLVPPEDDAH